MKYIFLPIAFSFILTGCQSTTSHSNKNVTDSNTNINAATPAEIHDLLIISNSISNKKSHKDSLITYTDIWDRIRQNIRFDVPHNKSVMQHRTTYLRDQHALNNLFKRAEPFLFYIVEELEKNNIPIEIALLPLVESAFNPHAKSHANALGLWQFVASTGKQFGLKEDWWYEGRKDIVASTQSAIKYLKYLNAFFDGDWLLALAAYNSGEGRVQRSIRRNARLNKSTNYWDLSLPKETRDYVPKLFAVIDIIDRAEKLGVKLHPIANKPNVAAITLNSQIDISIASNIANISTEQFKTLNPAFKQWATQPNQPVRILLPIENAKTFKKKLILLPEKERMAWQRYKIKSGDSIGKIAQNFHVDLKTLQRINNIRGTRIKIGKYLLIPVSSNANNNVSLLPKNIQEFIKSNESSSNKVTHIVKSGDSLWNVSRKYNVSSKSLAQWNNISSKSTLRLGQKLVVWTGTNSSAVSIKNKPKNIIYKVKSGDSLSRIAHKFKVKIKDIERWNKLTRRSYLKLGQKLKISVL